MQLFRLHIISLLVTGLSPLCTYSQVFYLFPTCIEIKDDSLQIDCILKETQQILERAESDSVLAILEPLEKKTTQLNQLNQNAAILRQMARAFYLKSEYDTATQILKRAVIAYKSTQNYPGASRALNDLASAYRDKGDFETAVEVYSEVIAMNEQQQMDSLNTAPFINIATVYSYLGEQEKETSYIKRSNAMAKKYKQLRLHTITDQALSAIYFDKGDLDSARYHAQSALEGGQKMKNDLLIAYSYLALSRVTDKEGDIAKTKYYHEKMLNHPGVPIFDRTRFMYFIGTYYLENKAYYKAQNQLIGALNQVQQIESNSLMRSIVRDLHVAYEATQDYCEAYTYLTEKNTLEETLLKEETQAKINELTIKYETAEKENENITLRAQNEKEKNRARQRLFIVFSLAWLLLGTIVVFIFYRRQALQKTALLKQTAELKEQKVEQLKQEQKIITFKAMIAGEETERSRLAKELHDGLGGMLSNLKLALDKSGDVSDKPSLGIFLQATKLVDKVSIELRRIAHNMMPKSLSKYGLITAIEDLCDEINFSKQIAVDFQYYSIDESSLKDNSLPIYRIIQELLNNVVKHAQATQLMVQLIQRDQNLYITVEDNGQGFEWDEAKQKNSHGLNNLQSRVTFLNGKLEYDTAKGRGTTVSVEIPI